MAKKDKKAHISEALAGGEIQALQSANADQHSDRITRFATLKHRAKNQENYLTMKKMLKTRNLSRL